MTKLSNKLFKRLTTFYSQIILITLLIVLISKKVTLLLYLHAHSYNLNDATHPDGDNLGQGSQEGRGTLTSFRGLDVHQSC